MKLTSEQKDRLVEVLLYYYFSDKDEKTLANPAFWNVINNLCVLNDINGTMISRAVRILICDENQPTEEETYYLLDSIGFSVRDINKMTGIYYQKQTKFKTDFLAGKVPKIQRRVSDIVMKKSMKDFILATYDFMGVFTHVDEKVIENIF